MKRKAAERKSEEIFKKGKNGGSVSLITEPHRSLPPSKESCHRTVMFSVDALLLRLGSELLALTLAVVVKESP